MFKYNEQNNSIETERFLLRRFTLEDAPKVAEICNAQEVYIGTLGLPHPYTEESAVWWISHQDENFEKIFITIMQSLTKIQANFMAASAWEST